MHKQGDKKSFHSDKRDSKACIQVGTLTGIRRSIDQGSSPSV